MVSTSILVCFDIARQGSTGGALELVSAVSLERRIPDDMLQGHEPKLWWKVSITGCVSWDWWVTGGEWWRAKLGWMAAAASGQRSLKKRSRLECRSIVKYESIRLVYLCAVKSPATPCVV